MDKKENPGGWVALSESLPPIGRMVAVVLHGHTTVVTGYVRRDRRWQLNCPAKDKTPTVLFWADCIPSPYPIPTMEERRREYEARMAASE